MGQSTNQPTSSLQEMTYQAVLKAQLNPQATSPRATSAAWSPCEPGQKAGRFLPPQPTSLQQLGIPVTALEELIFKLLLSKGVVAGRSIAAELCVPFNLLEPLFLELKNRLLLSYKQTTGMGDFLYTLTDLSRERALMAREITGYVGPVPVPFEQYLTAVEAQSVKSERPQQADLERAFADLEVSQEMLSVLGPAINSGRGLFLYGAPGNGKTSIAERICKSFKGHLFIPKALWVEGQIVLLYDQENHHLWPHPEQIPNHDSRWACIERPVIVVGGELTMEALEIRYNPLVKVSEAPLQMKANGGIFMIDDFGRQRINPQELLNRWIVPLEKRIDYLTLATGKKLMVPFDELILFSTNLDPGDLVDEAFLRRIPYKVHVDSPSEATFRKLLSMMAKKAGMTTPAEQWEGLWDYLINTHYKALNRPFRACQARDLLDQVVNRCHYRGEPPALSPEALDAAVANYFAVMQ